MPRYHVKVCLFDDNLKHFSCFDPVYKFTNSFFFMSSDLNSLCCYTYMGHGKPLHGNFKDNACWCCCWYKVTKDTNSPERYFTHKNVQFTYCVNN